LAPAGNSVLFTFTKYQELEVPETRSWATLTYFWVSRLAGLAGSFWDKNGQRINAASSRANSLFTKSFQWHPEATVAILNLAA
jgi:hypothetical protein